VHIEVRRAGPADVDPAAQALGEAFADYPWTRWTVDPNDHQSRVTELQRLSLRSLGLPFGQVWVGLVDGVVRCVATWMDSAVPVPRRVEADNEFVSEALEGSRHEWAVAASAQIQGWRPPARHFYLAAIGTTPSMQGRGLGKMVLAPMLRAADEGQLPAFLETSSETNVAFYSALGFEVVDHRQIGGGGPDVWAMLRRPRGGDTDASM